jgi:uncharacterized protein (DUF885 family)
MWLTMTFRAGHSLCPDGRPGPSNRSTEPRLRCGRVFPTMNIRCATFLLAGCLTINGAGSVVAPEESVAARLKAQNALFEEFDQADFKDFPERATSYRDYRYNDQLSDQSLAAIERPHESDVAYLRRIEALSIAGFSEQDVLSHDLFIRILKQRLNNYALKEYEMPINRMGGVHITLADLPRVVPLDSVKHYKAKCLDRLS